MNLSEINRDEVFMVTSVPDKDVRSQAIRLGVFEGAVLKCIYKVNKGPIILDNKGQEIAIGYNIAKRITVRKNKKMRLREEVDKLE